MLEVEKVDLYYGAAIALRQVSITVNVGAVTCVLGRNGVGKTSMLRAIVGAHPISAGIDPVGGRGNFPPADVRTRAARHRLGAARAGRVSVADGARKTWKPVSPSCHAASAECRTRFSICSRS